MLAAMMRAHLLRPGPSLVLLLLALGGGGCKRASQPAGAPGPAASTSKNLPQARAGSFSVGFVYVGPIGDGGWTYAHDEGRRHLEKTAGVHTAYVENVAEGAEAEQVIRGLARKGFDLVVGTSFGYMDAMEAAAAEFGKTRFVHIAGQKSNGTNFGNLFGAMESMKFLAGFIAGARARADGKTRLGYIAPYPIPEVIRLGNAVMRGARQSCPACTMEIRWINSWFDPSREREAADSLLKAGAHVVVTGADTPGPILAAKEAGGWAIGYDSENACRVAPERCLTTPYWSWGPVYVELVRRIRAGVLRAGSEYLDVSSGIVGLYGFMPGQKPPAGVPADAVARVQELLRKMQQGSFTRFDVFAPPLLDNHGRELIKAGEKLEQKDLEGLPGCRVCMGWLAQGIVGEPR